MEIPPGWQKGNLLKNLCQVSGDLSLSNSPFLSSLRLTVIALDFSDIWKTKTCDTMHKQIWKYKYELFVKGSQDILKKYYWKNELYMKNWVFINTLLTLLSILTFAKQYRLLFILCTAVKWLQPRRVCKIFPISMIKRPVKSGFGHIQLT